jgi:predicted RNase H-like HicB family nuclease
MQMEGKLTTFSMVIEGNKQTGYSALLPDVPGFFVAGSTIKEIEKETAKALPWYLDYLKQRGREAKPKKRTERQLALTVSSLPSREYHGPDYEPGVPHIYALRRRFFADIIELHVFRSTEAIIPPTGYEVVARVERDAAGNWPKWAQEAVDRRAARRRPGAGIPFGPGRISHENGLYMG